MITPAKLVMVLLSEDSVRIRDVFGTFDEFAQYAARRASILNQFKIRPNSRPEIIRRTLKMAWDKGGTIEVG